MVDNVRLMSVIYCLGLNASSIAKDLGINRMTVSNKLRGKSDWTISEARKLREVLSLSDQDTMDIFFGHNVAKNDT